MIYCNLICLLHLRLMYIYFKFISSDQSTAKVSGAKAPHHLQQQKKKPNNNSARKLQSFPVTPLLSPCGSFTPFPSISCSSSLVWFWLLVYLKEYSSLRRAKHYSSFSIITHISSLQSACCVLWAFLFPLFGSTFYFLNTNQFISLLTCPIELCH